MNRLIFEYKDFIFNKEIKDLRDLILSEYVSFRDCSFQFKYDSFDNFLIDYQEACQYFMDRRDLKRNIKKTANHKMLLDFDFTSLYPELNEEYWIPIR